VIVGDAVVVDGFEVVGSIIVVVVVGLTLGEVELYVIGVGRGGMTPLLLLFGEEDDDVGTGDDDGANDDAIGEIAGGSILSMTPWPLPSSLSNLFHCYETHTRWRSRNHNGKYNQCNDENDETPLSFL